MSKFVVFEGIDNSGKTTVSQIISDWIAEEFNIETIMTRHPGSTPIGKEIREILKHSPYPINSNAQALLFAADNSIFMNQILEPSLKEGKWVIGDRNNFISSLAYQIASGCSWDELDNVHKATVQTSMIDLLLVFKCDYNESQRRRALKNETKTDRYEDAGREYFDKLSKCYENLIESQEDRLKRYIKCTDGELNAFYVDAMAPLDEVVSSVKAHIKKVLLKQQ